MKKVLIYRETMEYCVLRRKELHLPPADCILLPASMPKSWRKERIKGYWKDVIIDDSIKLDGMTKEYFQHLYLGDW